MPMPSASVETRVDAEEFSERELGENRGKETPRLEYFIQMMKDIGCEIFKEVKELACDWANRYE